jgi:hypothetical protein
MSQSFSVNQAASKVSFQMDAELEEISGRAPQSVSGSLHVDLQDITRSTGLIKIDLLQLSIYQKKRGSADEEFGEEVKNDKQNEHMRTWLQISSDGPADQVELNRYVEFKLEKIESQAEKNPSKLSGDTRRLDLTVTGSLRLHGRSTTHTFPAEAVFSFSGDKVQKLQVTSKEPIGVDLEKHDVRPRSAFDQLAEKTLSALGAKVAKVAQVSLQLEAEPQ